MGKNKKKLKILIYGDYYRLITGFAREIRDILPYLEKDNDVRLVALGYNGFPVDRERYVYHTAIKEVKDHYAREILHYALDDFKPDIVLTVHDFSVIPKISFSLAHPGPWKWIPWAVLDSDPLDYYSRESLNWVHYCFFQSHHAAIETKMANAGVIGEVVYPSVDPKVFHKLDKKELRKKFNLEDFGVLVCAARGQQRKNVPVLLDAFQGVVNKRPNTALIIASGIARTKTDTGDLDGYELERFISDRGLNDYVLFPKGIDGSPIDDETLNIQYNLADIHVSTSVGEGWGLSFSESFASGVPSIAVDHSAVHEIVKGRGILVEPKAYTYNLDGSRYHFCHPSDIEEAIINLLDDDAGREKYGRAAEEFAKRLTPKSRAEQMLAAFQKLVKEDTQPIARR